MGKGPISKLLIPVIGLTQEAIAHHKETKAAAQDRSRDLEQDDSHQHEYDELDSDGATEEVWAMDDAQHDMHLVKSDAPQTEASVDVEKMLNDFAARYPMPQNPTRSHIENPVVIPQRRPGNRERGFIRCYAPILENCDIHQKEFLEFLDGFTKVIKYSNAFMVVNGAFGIAMTAVTYAGIVPGAALAGSLAFHVTVEASRRGYVLYETNKYLDGMNEHLFRPHGLYAMLMSYKPDSKDAFQLIQVNGQSQAPTSQSETAQKDPTQALNEAILKRLDGQGSKFAPASGSTHGELELPDAAPLIFPAIAELSEDQKQDAIKRAFKFMGDYRDSQAQAKFARENPGSQLANPGTDPKFASQFSDPNSAVSRHGLLGLAKGTPADAPTKKERAKMRRAMRSQQRYGTTQPPTNPYTPLGAVKTVLKKIKPGVIYLMVINLPSDEELEAARQLFGEGAEGAK